MAQSGSCEPPAKRHTPIARSVSPSFERGGVIGSSYPLTAMSHAAHSVPDRGGREKEHSSPRALHK